MPTRAQKQITFDTIGYTPNKTQELIHLSEARIILVVGGERGGKSKSSSSEGLARFHEGELYWLVGSEYEQTRPEFEYICEGLDKLGAQYKATKRIDPGEILVPELGFRIFTKSARDPRKLGMQAPNGIIGCEAAQLDFETFLRLLGRAAEKRGWIILSGTLEGSLGWYPEYYLRWSVPNEDDAEAFSLPSWTNTAIFPKGEQDPEILRLKASSSREWFLERYGGIPSPPTGRVFTEFSNKIHTGIGREYEFDPILPVYLWVDPGFHHAYAVLVVQKRGEEVWIVDEIYEKGLVTSDIIKVAKTRPWFPKVDGGAVDIAATQHQAMPAVSEIWQKEASVRLRSRKIKIRDGIERVKSFLIVNPVTGRSRLHINTKCKGIISEMGGCPSPITGQTAVYQWRRDREGIVIGETPEDKNNDACKALAYGLVDLFGYTEGISRKVKIQFF